MALDEQIETLFGSDVLEYFKNKQTGGENNQKGGRYEDFFVVMQLAKLFYLLFDNTRQDIDIHTQAPAFVDDLVIVAESGSSQHHFQLKDKIKVSWGSGSKSISDDFHKQKLLNDDVGIEQTRIDLVWSDEIRVSKLKKKIPSIIADFSDVIFFPKVQTVNQLLLLHEEFRNCIKAICFSDESDKLEALAVIILGHWRDKQTTVYSVKALLTELRNYFPNHLAKIDVAMELLPEVQAILSKITYFAYYLEKGYFSWSYKDGLDSGVLLYPVDSQAFNNFQQAIMKQKPSDFSELEGLLLWTDNSQTM